MNNATPETRSKHFSIRLPVGQARQIEELAARDANGASATIRRLLARALRTERRESDRHAS